MQTREQAELLLSKLIEKQPKDIIEYFNDGFKGRILVLKALDSAKQNLTAGELATQLNVSTARMATALNNLCAKGLVVREKTPQDARKTIVKLTTLGKAKIVEREKIIIDKTARFLGKLNENEIATLFSLVEKL